MKNLVWILLAVAIVGLFCATFIHESRHSQARSDEAMAWCRRMGGEAILGYSVSSNTFFLTGCKLK